jgi:TPR repeat protein
MGVRRIAVLLLLVSATNGFAGPVEDGRAAFDREDYPTAARLFAQAATSGEPRAEGMLGLMYVYGMGIQKDVKTGLQWLSKSIEHGNSGAANTVGEFYEDGKLVQQDWTTAQRYYLRAAEAGNSTAQKHLGDIYFYGRGAVSRDYGKAVEWYELAAKQSNADAEYTLGFIYFSGVGREKDYTQAVTWFQLGANHGNAAAEMFVGYFYDSGLGVPQDYSEAVTHYAVAARNGNIRAIGLLGEKYFNGQGVSRDFTRAYILLNLAAAQISPEYQQKIAEERDGAASKLSPQQLASAQAIAKRCSDVLATCEAIPGASPSLANGTPRPLTSQPMMATQVVATGSGFFINADGQIITNAHVVDGCAAVKLSSGVTLKQVAIDSDSDLALLNAGRKATSFARLRGGKGARLGESVIAAGYPLAGMLGSGTIVSSGNISALAGLGNDRRNIQISAPVQPGNSGGPLIGDDGAIVGVVSSKLDAIKVAGAINDIPQNVNFAVSLGTLQSFLNANNVSYALASQTGAKSSAVLSVEASRYTVQLQCWK